MGVVVGVTEATSLLHNIPISLKQDFLLQRCEFFPKFSFLAQVSLVDQASHELVFQVRLLGFS